MLRTLASVASTVHGRLIGNDADFIAVSTDTRQDVRGNLYVALTGEHFDGNDFIAAAAEAGAAGALVSRPADVSLGQVTVNDTRRAFAEMARAWRQMFSLPVFAVTGSSGKTTVKSMLAAILSVDREVCVTQGNLNNEIGVPISLMRLDAAHEAAVFELGANHAGEIDYLGGIVKPDIAIITNAGAAHLEGFGSVDGVALAKGELLEHIAPGGTAVLNFDDRYFEQWCKRAEGCQVLSFGLDARAACSVVGDAVFTESASRFCLSLPDNSQVDIELPLLGVHNVRNALAAAAASFSIGVGREQIAAGLRETKPVSGRLASVAGLGGSRLIDDSYNANPSSVRAALDSLARIDGTRIFVLGDMGELGSATIELHREIGRYATDCCDIFVGIGKFAAEAVAAFGPGGVAYRDIKTAAHALAPQLNNDVTVLVKASRAMGLEALVKLLRTQDAPGDSRC